MFANIAELQDANAARGGFWFTNMDHNGSTIASDLVDGRYFVVDDHLDITNPSAGRCYRIAAATPEAVIAYVPVDGSARYDSLDQALAAIAAL